MSQDPSDPELNAVESALGRLAPARSRLDRDRLMFQAGAISARSASRRGWVWPSIAAMLAVVVVSETLALATRPDPRVVVVQQPAPLAQETVGETDPVRILAQSRPSPSEGDELWAVGGGEALGLRRQVLRFGLEGLPDPPLLTQSGGSGPTTGAVPESPEPLRRYEFNKVLDLGGPS
jgi:hypothetical protein